MRALVLNYTDVRPNERGLMDLSVTVVYYDDGYVAHLSLTVEFDPDAGLNILGSAIADAVIANTPEGFTITRGQIMQPDYRKGN